MRKGVGGREQGRKGGEEEEGEGKDRHFHLYFQQVLILSSKLCVLSGKPKSRRRSGANQSSSSAQRKR